MDFESAGETFTLIGIFLAAVIFARLALKGKNLGRFRFQLSIFILIWAAAELPQAAATLGLISDTDYATLGLFVHMMSMAAFAVFVGIKSIDYFRYASVTPAPSKAAPSPVQPLERPEL